MPPGNSQMSAEIVHDGDGAVVAIGYALGWPESPLRASSRHGPEMRTNGKGWHSKAYER